MTCFPLTNYLFSTYLGALTPIKLVIAIELKNKPAILLIKVWSLDLFNSYCVCSGWLRTHYGWPCNFLRMLLVFVERSSDHVPESSQPKRNSSATNGKTTPLASDKTYSHSNQKRMRKEPERYAEYTNSRFSPEQSSSADEGSDQINGVSSNKAKGGSQKTSIGGKSVENASGCFPDTTSMGKGLRSTRGSNLKVVHIIISISLCQLCNFSACTHPFFAAQISSDIWGSHYVWS